MVSIKHIIDPDSDTVIILKRASSEIAPWDVTEQITPETACYQPTVDGIDWAAGLFGKKYTGKKRNKRPKGRLSSPPVNFSEDVEARCAEASSFDKLASPSLFGSGAATAIEEIQATDATSTAQDYDFAKGNPFKVHFTAGSKEIEEEGIHYYVSSRHMMLASPWFHRALTKNVWSESGRSKDDRRFHITTEDWDADALLIILNAFHLRNKQVPRTVSLKMLAKIAVLVDYYECGEAIELYTNMWINDLKVQVVVPPTYCRDLILWIWIAWVFDEVDQLKQASAVAIKTSTECFRVLGLPIPARVSDHIDLKRYQAIESVVEGMHAFLEKYRSNTYACPIDSSVSFQCGAFLLGALTKELDAYGLLSPRPEVPFLEVSFEVICEKLRNVKSPVWTKHDDYYNRSAHGCNLNMAVQGVITTAEAAVVGLDIISLKATHTCNVDKAV